jgi:hypothetical protein
MASLKGQKTAHSTAELSSIDGVLDSSKEGTNVGLVEGMLDGALDGSKLGWTEGLPDGSVDGAELGSLRSSEGVTDGSILGVCVYQKALSTGCAGSSEGVPEGARWF